MTADPDRFCREVEDYLCRKNDGHLIRIVGPAFELVTGWARQGIPLKIVCQGVDRCFERYYAKGPRRRPVRIEFCDADVLDAFDAWRRALGLTRDALGTSTVTEPVAEEPARSRVGLPAHVERVIAALESYRSRADRVQPLDDAVERAIAELHAARETSPSLRGAARAAFQERLDAIDRGLMALARQSIDPQALAGLAREAELELRPFRDRMSPDAYARSLEACIERLVCDHVQLPRVAFV